MLWATPLRCRQVDFIVDRKMMGTLLQGHVKDVEALLRRRTEQMQWSRALTLLLGVLHMDLAPTFRSYQLVLQSLAQHHQWEMGVKLANTISTSSQTNRILLKTLLLAALEAKAPEDEVRGVVAASRLHGVKMDHVLYGHLFHYWLPAKWQHVLETIPLLQADRVVPSPALLNHLVHACAVGQQWQLSLRLQQLQSASRIPIDFNFHRHALSSFDKTHWQLAIAYFSGLSKDQRQTPPILLSMAQVLARCGKWRASIKILDNVKSHLEGSLQVNQGDINAVLNECIRHSTSWRKGMEFFLQWHKDTNEEEGLAAVSALMERLRESGAWEVGIQAVVNSQWRNIDSRTLAHLCDMIPPQQWMLAMDVASRSSEIQPSLLPLVRYSGLLRNVALLTQLEHSAGSAQTLPADLRRGFQQSYLQSQRWLDALRFSVSDHDMPMQLSRFDYWKQALAMLLVQFQQGNRDRSKDIVKVLVQHSLWETSMKLVSFSRQSSSGLSPLCEPKTVQSLIPMHFRCGDWQGVLNLCRILQHHFQCPLSATESVMLTSSRTGLHSRHLLRSCQKNEWATALSSYLERSASSPPDVVHALIQCCYRNHKYHELHRLVDTTAPSIITQMEFSLSLYIHALIPLENMSWVSALCLLVTPPKQWQGTVFQPSEQEKQLLIILQSFVDHSFHLDAIHFAAAALHYRQIQLKDPFLIDAMCSCIIHALSEGKVSEKVIQRSNLVLRHCIHNASESRQISKLWRALKVVSSHEKEKWSLSLLFLERVSRLAPQFFHVEQVEECVAQLSDSGKWEESVRLLTSLSSSAKNVLSPKTCELVATQLAENENWLLLLNVLATSVSCGISLTESTKLLFPRMIETLKEREKSYQGLFQRSPRDTPNQIGFVLSTLVQVNAWREACMLFVDAVHPILKTSAIQDTAYPWHLVVQCLNGAQQWEKALAVASELERGVDGNSIFPPALLLPLLHVCEQRQRLLIAVQLIQKAVPPVPNEAVQIILRLWISSAGQIPLSERRKCYSQLKAFTQLEQRQGIERALEMMHLELEGEQLVGLSVDTSHVEECVSGETPRPPIFNAIDEKTDIWTTSNRYALAKHQEYLRANTPAAYFDPQSVSKKHMAPFRKISVDAFQNSISPEEVHRYWYQHGKHMKKVVVSPEFDQKDLLVLAKHYPVLRTGPPSVFDEVAKSDLQAKYSGAFLKQAFTKYRHHIVALRQQWLSTKVSPLDNDELTKPLPINILSRLMPYLSCPPAAELFERIAVDVFHGVYGPSEVKTLWEANKEKVKAISLTRWPRSAEMHLLQVLQDRGKNLLHGKFSFPDLELTLPNGTHWKRDKKEVEEYWANFKDVLAPAIGWKESDVEIVAMYLPKLIRKESERIANEDASSLVALCNEIAAAEFAGAHEVPRDYHTGADVMALFMHQYKRLMHQYRRSLDYSPSFSLSSVPSEVDLCLAPPCTDGTPISPEALQARWHIAFRLLYREFKNNNEKLADESVKLLLSAVHYGNDPSDDRSWELALQLLLPFRITIQQWKSAMLLFHRQQDTVRQTAEQSLSSALQQLSVVNPIIGAKVIELFDEMQRCVHQSKGKPIATQVKLSRQLSRLLKEVSLRDGPGIVKMLWRECKERGFDQVLERSYSAQIEQLTSK